MHSKIADNTKTLPSGRSTWARATLDDGRNRHVTKGHWSTRNLGETTSQGNPQEPKLSRSSDVPHETLGNRTARAQSCRARSQEHPPRRKVEQPRSNLTSPSWRSVLLLATMLSAVSAAQADRAHVNLDGECRNARDIDNIDTAEADKATSKMKPHERELNKDCKQKTLEFARIPQRIQVTGPRPEFNGIYELQDPMQCQVCKKDSRLQVKKRNIECPVHPRAKITGIPKNLYHNIMSQGDIVHGGLLDHSWEEVRNDRRSWYAKKDNAGAVTAELFFESGRWTIRRRPCSVYDTHIEDGLSGPGNEQSNLPPEKEMWSTGPGFNKEVPLTLEHIYDDDGRRRLSDRGFIEDYLRGWREEDERRRRSRK